MQLVTVMSHYVSFTLTYNMVTYLVILLLVIPVTFFMIYFKIKFNYWKYRKVFTISPEIPFGNLKKLIFFEQTLADDLRNLYNLLRSKKLKYGGYYVIGKPAFIPVDLNLIKNILVKDFQYFTDHSNYLNEKADPLTDNIVFSKGTKWKELRTKFTPVFTPGKLKMMVQLLLDCAKDLPFAMEEAINKGGPIDIKEMCARYTIDVIGSCAFGIDCHCLKNEASEFQTYGRIAMESNFPFVSKNLFLLWPQLLDILKVKAFTTEVTDFFFKVVKETIDYRDKNKIRRNDFMQLLIDLKQTQIKKLENGDYIEQSVLSLNDLVANAFVFFLAGFETTSTTLTFMMYELTKRLDVQDKLRKEVNDVLKTYDNRLNFEAIKDMPYLEQCMMETLRKYPPLPVLTRECTKQYCIPNSNLVIEKGTLILIPTYGIQHDPDFYPFPEEFIPERFTEKNKMDRSPFTFLAFGEGPRICMGIRLAFLQVKVGLIYFLRNYEFSIDSKTKEPITFDPKEIVSMAHGGIWINARKLHNF